MQVFKAPKLLFFFFLTTIASLATSCSKEHDLVSEFVVTEKVTLQKVAEDTTIELAPSIESKQLQKRTINNLKK